MLKRFNMLALIVLLVFQTMITPVAATAQGIVEQEDVNTEASEIQDSANEAGVPSENEGLRNDRADADEEEAAGDDSLEGEGRDGVLAEDPESDEKVDGDDPTVDLNADKPEEDTKVTDNNVAEENIPKMQATDFEIYEARDLGNIFTFDSFQKDKQDIEDGAEIEFNTQYQLQYHWETQGLEAKAGDTATLQLPDVFEHWTNAPDQNIVAGGVTVGTYNINNGELTFVFNENIEDASVQNGYVGLNLEFSEEKFLEEWEQEIDFDGDGEKDLTVIVIPGEVETNLDKEGHPDSNLNAREITWTVEFTNGSNEAIENGVLTDILPNGVGGARDFVVRELSFDFYGNKIVGEEVAFNEPTIDGNEFELSFDNVPARSGYRIEYTTTITDYKINEFTNDALFTYGNEELDAKTTVYSGERSNPIQKEGTYNWDTEQIDWTIIVNENGMDIENAIVHDELPEELILDKDSISVTMNHQDTGIEVDTFPITLGKVYSDEVYRIHFSTDIEWTKVNGGEYQHHNEFTNKTELTDGEIPIGEGDKTVDLWRESLLSKSGNANDYNYEDKILSWTIDVNKAKHPISNAVLTDILPAGLGTIAFEDITIEGAQVDADDITITPNSDGTQTVVINLGNIDSVVTVSYETEVENFVENNFKNEASLGGDGIGEETPKDEATVNPPGNAFSKGFRGIDYNKRTLDWRISVNPQREAITELIIEDTFPNNGMILLPETIIVSVDGQEEKLVEGTDYTLNPNTDDEGTTGYHKGFTIELTNIDQDNPLNDQLIVDFKTSYDPQLEVDGDVLDPHAGDPTLYINYANFTGKTVNGNDFDRNDDAQTRVREDSWNSGKKEGQLVHFDEEGKEVEDWVSGAERKIAWQLYTNYQQQNLGTGVSVTDTLDYEGAIDKDSIVVSVYEVDKDGNTDITDQTIDDYSVEVNGKQFTLTFDEEFAVDERYVIEFTTTVPDISEASYTNNAMLKVGENEYPYSATVNYDRWDDFLDKQTLGHTGNDVFIGEELEWQVTVNESLSIIKDAKIKDTISAGLTYVEGSLEIVSQSGTELVEDNDYILEVSESDEGETILDISFENDVTEALTLNYTTVVTAEDGQAVNNKIELDGVGIENKSKETSSLTAKQFSWVGGDFNPNRGAIKVLKVDSNSGEVIETDEATFELHYELNGERLQFGEEFTTVNGILEIGNLPLRTYYLTEVEAPNGYVLSEEEIEIVVDKTFNNNEANVFEVTFENVKKIDITVEKVWDDANNQDGIRSDSITVNLLAGTEKVASTELNKDNDWSHSFIELPEIDVDGEKITYTVEEVEVVGYETTIAGTSEDGFVITNTHEPELINLEGTKTWDDAENQDGKRPDSITVRLLAEGEEVAFEEVTADDEWNYSFTDLPKFENGAEINYTIQEEGVEDYSTEITGMNITNSYTPEQTSINVVKAWDDANNQDGIRSESITVKLIADGEETGKEVQLNEGNNWQADFTDLDVYVDGQEIVYTVEEVEVAGYETSISGTSEDGFVITNKHEPELINLEGTKTWDDAYNQDGVRPDAITVNLLANGIKVEDIEVTAETDWTFAFTDLPKFENGEEINYTVQEDGVEDYSTEITGMNITNSYTPAQTSINVVKAWNDANNQDGIRSDSITVKLLANGEETGQEVQLNEGNNWQADFTELDVYVDGQEIVYTVEEVEVAGYETTISGTSEDGFVITNTHEPELINLEGTKTWDDADNQDGVRPASITVNLLANGIKVEDVEVMEETDWTFSFTDLPKFENGAEINYTVQEDGVEDYSTEIDGMDITNSYTPGKTSVNVVKNWKDENYKDVRPDSITVKLLADGEEAGQELELNADNNWQVDFINLDEYVDGEKVVYTIEEVEINGYVTESISGNADDGFVITNRPAKVSVGDYVWYDANKDGLQDDTDVPLEGVVLTVEDEDGNPVIDVYGNPVGPTTTDEKGWYTFDNLPIDHTYTVRIDQEASAEVLKEYVPTLHEEGDDHSIDSSTWEAKSRHLVEDGERDPTLDFGFVKEVIEVSGVKIWEDADNQDGNRPDSITVNLLANGEQVDSIEVTEENDWKYSFTDLPKHEYLEEIVYTVTENTVESYTQEIDGYDITNHYTPGETGVTVTKNWQDANNQDGIRPGSIEVQLIADGEAYGDPVELSEANNWTYTWPELAEKAAGTTIVYTVEEVTEVPGYEVTVNDKDHGNIIITNAYTPEEIEITGTKTWEDADNEAGTRPDSITVNLLANGSIVDSIEVTDADDWNYSFTGLAKYESSEEIEYSITEVEVDGYETSINGYDITNTLIPVEEESEEPGSGGESGDKDPKDPTDLEAAGGEGDNLPKTATNIYNLTLIGFGLMLLGLIFFIIRRKRIE